MSTTDPMSSFFGQPRNTTGQSQSQLSRAVIESTDSYSSQFNYGTGTTTIESLMGTTRNGTSQSGNGTSQSGNGTSQSGNGTSQSGNGTSQSGNGTSQSGNGTSQSGNGTSQSGNGTSQSGNGTSQSGNGTSQSGNGTSQPTGPEREFIVPPPAASEADRLRGSLQQILSKNVGEFVVVEFLIGTDMIVKRQGILNSVGAAYIVLYEEVSKTYIVCDLSSIRFVTFYLPGQRPPRTTTAQQR